MKGNFYIVEISRVRIKGKLRAKPENDNAAHFALIKGTKTLSGNDLTTIRMLGFEVRYTDWSGD